MRMSPMVVSGFAVVWLCVSQAGAEETRPAAGVSTKAAPNLIGTWKGTAGREGRPHRARAKLVVTRQKGWSFSGTLSMSGGLDERTTSMTLSITCSPGGDGTLTLTGAGSRVLASGKTVRVTVTGTIQEANEHVLTPTVKLDGSEKIGGESMRFSARVSR